MFLTSALDTATRAGADPRVQILGLLVLLAFLMRRAPIETTAVVQKVFFLSTPPPQPTASTPPTRPLPELEQRIFQRSIGSLAGKLGAVADTLASLPSLLSIRATSKAQPAELTIGKNFGLTISLVLSATMEYQVNAETFRAEGFNVLAAALTGGLLVLAYLSAERIRTAREEREQRAAEEPRRNWFIARLRWATPTAWLGAAIVFGIQTLVGIQRAFGKETLPDLTDVALMVLLGLAAVIGVWISAPAVTVVVLLVGLVVVAALLFLSGPLALVLIGLVAAYRFVGGVALGLLGLLRALVSRPTEQQRLT